MWLRQMVKIVTTDLRGSSELELPIGRPGVLAHDGDGGAAVCRAATLERGECNATARDTQLRARIISACPQIC